MTTDLLRFIETATEAEDAEPGSLAKTRDYEHDKRFTARTGPLGANQEVVNSWVAQEAAAWRACSEAACFRWRSRHPETLAPLPPGEVGVLRHLDLASARNVLAVLTEDLGYAVADGFEILGRAQGAELRGCSLAMEEWLGVADTSA